MYATHPSASTYYQSSQPLTAPYSTSTSHLSLSGGLKSLPKTGPVTPSTDTSPKIQNNNMQNLSMNKNGINNNMININSSSSINSSMSNNSIALNTTGGLQSRILSTATATLRPHSPGSPAVPYAGADTYASSDMNAVPGTYVHLTSQSCTS
jgi:hypothetical protein